MSIRIGRLLGFMGALATLPLLTAACNTTPPPEVPTAEVPPAPTGSAPVEPEEPAEVKAPVAKPKAAAKTDAGSDKENPVMRCGPRDSYAYVADYQCSDGTRPLGSDIRAGGAARRGNVGANSKGHIIDLYVIPCPGAPVEVYVDMYGCPEYQQMLLGN